GLQPQRMFVTHAYAAAKSAAVGFVKAVASRYAAAGIRVNAVAPGLTATPMARRAAGDPDTVAYARSKQPLAEGMLPPESVAAAAGIRVNAVAPGLTATPMARRAAGDPDTVAYARSKQPLAEGMLPPESVAAAACFLLSDDARHVTGQVLAVDGGASVVEA